MAVSVWVVPGNVWAPLNFKLLTHKLRIERLNGGWLWELKWDKWLLQQINEIELMESDYEKAEVIRLELWLDDEKAEVINSTY